MKGFRTKGKPVTNLTNTPDFGYLPSFLKCLLMTRSNTFQLSFDLKLEKLVKDLEKHFCYELFSVFRPMNVIGNYGVTNIAK